MTVESEITDDPHFHWPAAVPRLTQLDLTGPFEVFAKMPGASVHLLWKSGEPVAAETGMRILPDTTLAECPPLDVPACRAVPACRR